MADWLARCLSHRFTFRIGLPMVSKCCLGRSGPPCGGPSRPGLSYCFTFRRLSGSGLEVLSGALGPALRRALAPRFVLLLHLPHRSGSGLEVLSGRAGPRPPGLAGWLGWDWSGGAKWGHAGSDQKVMDL